MKFLPAYVWLLYCDGLLYNDVQALCLLIYDNFRSYLASPALVTTATVPFPHGVIKKIGVTFSPSKISAL